MDFPLTQDDPLASLDLDANAIRRTLAAQQQQKWRQEQAQKQQQQAPFAARPAQPPSTMQMQQRPPQPPIPAPRSYPAAQSSAQATSAAAAATSAGARSLVAAPAASPAVAASSAASPASSSSSTPSPYKSPVLSHTLPAKLPGTSPRSAMPAPRNPTPSASAAAPPPVAPRSMQNGPQQQTQPPPLPTPQNAPAQWQPNPQHRPTNAPAAPQMQSHSTYPPNQQRMQQQPQPQLPQRPPLQQPAFIAAAPPPSMPSQHQPATPYATGSAPSMMAQANRNVTPPRPLQPPPLAPQNRPPIPSAQQSQQPALPARAGWPAPALSQQQQQQPQQQFAASNARPMQPSTVAAQHQQSATFPHQPMQGAQPSRAGPMTSIAAPSNPWQRSQQPLSAPPAAASAGWSRAPPAAASAPSTAAGSSAPQPAFIPAAAPPPAAANIWAANRPQVTAQLQQQQHPAPQLQQNARQAHPPTAGSTLQRPPASSAAPPLPPRPYPPSMPARPQPSADFIPSAPAPVFPKPPAAASAAQRPVPTISPAAASSFYQQQQQQHAAKYGQSSSSWSNNGSSSAAAAAAAASSYPRNRAGPAAAAAAAASGSVTSHFTPVARPAVQILSQSEIDRICEDWNNAGVATRTNPLNPSTAGSFVYPSNLPERAYQREIAQTAFLHNTLVCLPTGLGKTLIAAVVMYNFYRWFPSGKIVFVAPTRPLVQQQKDACCDTMGIEESHTVVCVGNATGADAKGRQGVWASEDLRVIFATPQCVLSDIHKGHVPLNRITLFIMDECHKAKGKYAYCEIVRLLRASGHDHRIVGLSATPGKDTHDVKEVARNIAAVRLEARGEADEELQPYLHARELQPIVIRPTESTGALVRMLDNLARPFVKTLVALRVGIDSIEPARLSVVALNNAQKSLGFALNQAKSKGANQSSVFTAIGQLGVLRKLLSVRDKLRTESAQLAWTHVQETIIGDDLGRVATGKTGKAQLEQPKQALIALRNSVGFQQFATALKAAAEGLKVDPNAMMMDGDDGAAGGAASSSSSAAAASMYSILPAALDGLRAKHPKMHKLLELVSVHFSGVSQIEDGSPNEGEDNDGAGAAAAAAPAVDDSKASSNVMIFTAHRDSVDEIVEWLSKLDGDLVRASKFIGQSKTVQGRSGMKQKEQNEVLKRFRAGEINVLVATSIGEEGLDIGHVDLIVSYDSIKSPLRTIQRFGRTGRKRAGRCVTLVMEGAEEEEYRRSIADKLMLATKIKALGRTPPWLKDITSARMLPLAITPTIQMVAIMTATQTKPNKRKRKAAAEAAAAAAAAAADDAEEDPSAAAAADDEAVDEKKHTEPSPEPDPEALRRQQLMEGELEQQLAALEGSQSQSPDLRFDEISLHSVTAAADSSAPSKAASPAASALSVSAMLKRQNQIAAEEAQKLRAERQAKKQRTDNGAVPLMPILYFSDMFTTDPNEMRLSLLPPSLRAIVAAQTPVEWSLKVDTWVLPKDPPPATAGPSTAVGEAAAAERPSTASSADDAAAPAAAATTSLVDYVDEPVSPPPSQPLKPLPLPSDEDDEPQPEEDDDAAMTGVDDGAEQPSFEFDAEPIDEGPSEVQDPEPLPRAPDSHCLICSAACFGVLCSSCTAASTAEAAAAPPAMEDAQPIRVGPVIPRRLSEHIHLSQQSKQQQPYPPPEVIELE